MKNNIYFILVIFFAFISSCTDEQNSYGDRGNVLLSVSMSDGPVQETRASSVLPDNWNPSENCLIQLFKGDDLFNSYEGLSKLPSQLTLEVGEYTLKITAGQEAEASFDDCYYEGEKIFSVIAGETEVVTLECKLKNVLSSVEFTSALEAVLDTESKVYITGNIGAELEWTIDNNEQTGYFILSGITTLSWSFEGKVNGKNISVANIISPANSNTNYILTFDYDESGVNTPEGGLIFKLDIIEPTLKEDVIDYDPDGIEIEGDGFDLGNPDPIIEGTSQEVTLSIGSVSELTSLLVQVDDQTKSAFALTDSNFDFINMSEADKSTYAQKGIVFTEPILLRSEESQVNKYAVSITAEKVQQLPVGEYVFDMRIVNGKGNSANTKMKIIISEEPVVSTNDIVSTGVWAKRATLTATKLKDAESFSFDYRIFGEESWTTVSAVLADDQTTISAEITGLSASTIYEYRANGGTYNGEIKLFTTEEAAQLPNSNFTNWKKSGKVWLIYGEDEDMFWDSGNHGSATLNEDNNVTTQSKSYGSIQLKSQFAGISGNLGRFAAGNVFAGKYVKTILNILDPKNAGGELQFGREFTSRPTRLRVKYKYISEEIDTIDGKITLPQNLIDEGAKAGEKDKGHIYIALSDKEAPYTIINTTSNKNTISLFNKEDSNIIAYGELVIHDSTTSEGLEEYTIELDYKSYDRKPTHIIVVCSSSKYGDYFSGALGSTLWMENLELIYE